MSGVMLILAGLHAGAITRNTALTLVQIVLQCATSVHRVCYDIRCSLYYLFILFNIKKRTRSTNTHTNQR